MWIQGPKHFGISWAACLGPIAGSWTKNGALGREPAPIWDASVASSDFAHFPAPIAPKISLCDISESFSYEKILSIILSALDQLCTGEVVNIINQKEIM